MSGIPAREVLEQRVVLGMPVAQHDELDVTLQEPVGDLGQQVPALLRVEPADLGEQRDVGPLGQPGLRWSQALQPALPATTVAAS